MSAKKISIRANIISYLLGIVFIISTMLLGLQFYFGNKLAIEAAHTTFSQVSETIENRIQSIDSKIVSLVNLAEIYPGTWEKPEVFSQHKTLEFFIAAMENNPNIYGSYIGYTNGDFYMVYNLKVSDKMYERFKVGKEARWVVSKIKGEGEERTKYYRILDAHLRVLENREEKSDYDPRKRPWYVKADQTDKATKTTPYVFTTLQAPGVTYAKKLPSGDVLGIDISLATLENFLKEQKFAEESEIFIFSPDGRKLISTNDTSKDENKNTSDDVLALVSKKMGDEIASVKQGSTEHFAYVNQIPSNLDTEELLGITVSKDELTRPYMRTVYVSLVIAAVLMLIAIPLVAYSTIKIVRPIRRLIEENNLIRQRRFDEVKPVETYIQELMDLSESLVSMSADIKAYQEAQRNLMDSFIQLIAGAIDAKSPYTGGHCNRVPELAVMLAEKASESTDGTFKDFHFETEDEWREFRIGAWLHDCGKVVTPEYVVDKATKLETIYNRIHEVRARFEIFWRDAVIKALERKLNGENPSEVDAWLEEEHRQIQDDFVFIAECNIGGEFMDEAKQQRVKEIGEKTWIRHFDDRLGLSQAEMLRCQDVPAKDTPAEEKLLSDRPEHIIKRENFDYEDYYAKGFKTEVPEHFYNYGEIYNLCIPRGTLTPEERFKINEHVIMTIQMLEALPFPDTLSRIPEYAGTHHETMIGTGYPRQLDASELSLPGRIMAIADVFEALTASDRPYKKAKTLSEAVKIMGFMRKDQHIDSELFELFLTSGVYKKYAEAYLKPNQVDEVDISAYVTKKENE